MSHAAQTYVLLEVPCDKLWPIVGDDARLDARKSLAGTLDDQLDILLGHSLLNFPVHDVAAIAVQKRCQVEEGSGNVDVCDIDVPVVMRAQWLNKPRALLRWLAGLAIE